VDDPEKGLIFQRELDVRLEEIMERYREINSLDSISYLMSPESVQKDNIRFVQEIFRSWPELKKSFREKLEKSDLSEEACAALNKSFDTTGRFFEELAKNGPPTNDHLADVERSWYIAKVKGKYRFLTLIRYSHDIADMEKLRQADHRLLAAVKSLPVHVSISGPRQAMEAVLSSLVSELVKLGLYVLVSVVAFFLVLFRHPLGVMLSLIPMTGAFCVTLGFMAAAGLGVPFSIVGVAPLIFGLGMDNGVHVVMGSSREEGGSVEQAMTRVTRPIVFTSLANVMGFVAMITSQHYSLEFLGWTMVIGMASAVGITLTTLPALLLLIEQKRNRGNTVAETSGSAAEPQAKVGAGQSFQ
jgi:predicted RND superfamily exporter protein